MIEIKFDKKKKKKGSKVVKQTSDTPRKNIETSKKLAWFSAVCFAVSIMYSILIFTYGAIQDKMIDYTMLITLITVTGAVFGATTTFYYNKSKSENIFKIRRSFLKLKFLILKVINLLDETRTQTELENELAKIDDGLNESEIVANQDIEYNG